MPKTENVDSPLSRLFELLKEDQKDLSVLLIYVAINGILMLAVPLTAQALVNTIAAGIFLQPLVVLSLVLLSVLIFVGAIRLFKLVLVETLQQRIFARVALRLAYRLPRISTEALNMRYAPELANRFFDVITIQKAWSKILLDGPLAVLQIFIGLLLLAFYSPILLAFDLIFILLILFIIFGLGFNGLKTSIQESARKYRVAGWLEELGRCNLSFKLANMPSFLMNRTDFMVLDYLSCRKKHFAVLFRHALGNYLLYALISSGILAVGGWLVIERQLTLGQLVAAEIVVVGVLAALEKMLRLLEDFYDLLTALEKIGHIVDLEVESADGIELSPGNLYTNGANIAFHDVSFGFGTAPSILKKISLNIKPGERVGLVGPGGSGKTTLTQLLCGLFFPSYGMVEINGVDTRQVSLSSLRQWVELVGDSRQIFEGTLEENITLGKDGIRHEDLKWALALTELEADLVYLPEGIKTRLTSEGRNLSLSQRQRLLIARAIVERPQLLILDEALFSIDIATRTQLLRRLTDRANSWTLLIITHLPEVLQELDKVYVLENGALIEAGEPKTLLQDSHSALSRLFTPPVVEGVG